VILLLKTAAKLMYVRDSTSTFDTQRVAFLQQVETETSHMARCVTFAVARIAASATEHRPLAQPRLLLHSSSTVRRDRQTSRQTSRNDNKAHSLRT